MDHFPMTMLQYLCTQVTRCLCFFKVQTSEMYFFFKRKSHRSDLLWLLWILCNTLFRYRLNVNVRHRHFWFHLASWSSWCLSKTIQCISDLQNKRRCLSLVQNVDAEQQKLDKKIDRGERNRERIHDMDTKIFCFVFLALAHIPSEQYFPFDHI